MDRRTRPYYLIGAALIVGGLVHLGILLATHGSWSGPLSWRKPATFGLSFGLTLITIAWVAGHLPLGDRPRRWLLDSFATACVTEVALITLQAWRHVPSHFNMETPLDTAISRVLAAGGGVLIVVIAALTVISWRPHPALPPSMRLAIVTGLLALDVALAIGAVMIVAGVLDVTQGAQQAAYTVGTRWKPAHFMPMHGILALPTLAWLLSHTPWPERRRTQLIAAAATAYALLCALAITTAIADIAPQNAPLLTTVLAAAAILFLGTTTLLTLAHTTPTSPTSASPAPAAPASSSPTPAPPTPASPTAASPTPASPAPAAPASSSPAPASPVSAAPASSSPVSAAPASSSPAPASPAPASPVSASLAPALPASAPPTSASPTPASPAPASPTAASPALAPPASA
jgi:hypothetical protein